jgi:predicted transcriptional regulator
LFVQHELDIPQESFRLARIEREDVCSSSDNLRIFREHILQNESNYPGIGRWLANKVLDGIKSGGRVGYIGFLNDRPVAAAVLKKGKIGKFCHLKVESEARSRYLGDLFFVIMTLELRHDTDSVRFTLPETLWHEKGDFFKSFGFATAIPSHRQYRLADKEFFCQTEFSQLLLAARAKLPNLFGNFRIHDHSLLTGAVLALHPEPLEKILSGEKTVEIRNRFSSHWEGRRVSLYATRPQQSLAGEARIGRVVKGRPDEIWENFGARIGCNRAEFESYVGKRAEIFAIMLDQVTPYRDQVPLAQLSHLLGVNLPAPQSYLSLETNDDWLSAVALSAALQGTISTCSARTTMNELHSPGRPE